MQHLDKHNYVPFLIIRVILVLDIITKLPDYDHKISSRSTLNINQILKHFVPCHTSIFCCRIPDLFIDLSIKSLHFLFWCNAGLSWTFFPISLSLSWYILLKTNKIYMKMWAYMTYALYHMGQTRGLLLYTVWMQRKRNKSSFTWHVYDFQDRISSNLINLFATFFKRIKFSYLHPFKITRIKKLHFFWK